MCGGKIMINAQFYIHICIIIQYIFRDEVRGDAVLLNKSHLIQYARDFLAYLRQTHATNVLKILKVLINNGLNIRICIKILFPQFAKKLQIPKTAL